MIPMGIFLEQMEKFGMCFDYADTKDVSMMDPVTSLANLAMNAVNVNWFN